MLILFLQKPMNCNHFLCEYSFEKIISIKYDIPNDKLSMFDDYKVEIDNFYAEIMAEHA